MSSILTGLNDAQRAAVEYCSGPELVIAGAGSGKTRVLTHKIAYLLELGVQADRIMALTFTNKAAREMKERIAALVGNGARRLWMGTFHSILLRILRLHADRLGFRYDFTIYDAADSRSLVKLIIQELGLDDKKYENRYKPSAIASAISNAKNALISPERYAADGRAMKADSYAGRSKFADIFRMYCERCRTAQAMDFDDILVYANILLRENPDLAQYYQQWFEYVLVDEYQDTNFAQSLVVNRLVQGHHRLCVVGDDAQSIYSFRGANIANILGMNERYPDLRLFKLERNYRSTQTIVKAAGSLIRHNRGQIPKEVYSENEPGEKLEVVEAYNDFEEASFLAGAVSRRLRLSQGTLEDMAVLYRTNAQSRVLEEALRRRSIPYRIYGGLTFYQRKEVKDALAYFRLTVNIDDDEALRRVINYPARGIGKTTMDRVRDVALNKGISMWKVVSDPDGQGLQVNKGTATKLHAFAEIIGELHSSAAKLDAYALGRDIYNRTGLLAQFANTSTPEEVSKRENLNELLAALKEFVERPREKESDTEDARTLTMGAFLSEVSLLTDQDSEEEDNTPKLTLMTVHAAKGLEFDHVFITGMEENLFPGSQSLDSPEELEEERRLLYVAITRARKTVWLSHANQRFRNGSTTDTIPSRFLSEIDGQYLNGAERRRWTPEPAPTSWLSMTARPSAPTSPTESRFSAQHRPTEPSHTRNLAPVKRRKSSAPAARPSGPAPFAPGDRVSHSKFGIGVITSYTDDPEPMVEADFTGYGHRKLLLRFASLEKL